jgi:hypothetical protein
MSKSDASAPQNATVTSLAAEVHVLMVGSRQVTLSVAKQLDRVSLEDFGFTPFGRIRTGVKVSRQRRWWSNSKTPRSRAWRDDDGKWWCDVMEDPDCEFVGRRESDGALVIAEVDDWAMWAETYGADDEDYQKWLGWSRDLPLIVLAGLR